jgi:hypothetical protein
MLVLFRQQAIVHKIGVDHHAYRRSAKEERGCGQTVIRQPRDYIVEILHDFLSGSSLTGTALMSSGSLARTLYDAVRTFSDGRAMVPLIPLGATAQGWLWVLGRAIDVTL